MPADIDWIAIRSGTIPWHPDGYAEASAAHARLLRTPHDDWDRTPWGSGFPPDAGERLELPGLHQVDSVVGQVARFIARRYAGAPVAIVLSHVKRYALINDFLREHAERLREDGLVVVQRRVAGEWFSTALIRVLTVVCYEARAPGRSGADARTFNYGRVARAARRLLADPGGEPG